MMRFLLFGLLLASAIAAHAQPQSSADVVTWTSRLTETSGDPVLTLSAVIEDGWRVYASGSPVGRPLRLLLPTRDAVQHVRTARRSTGYDPSTGQSYPYFTRRIRIEATMARSQNAREIASRAEVSYMACNDSVCLRPSRSPIGLDEGRR